MHSNLAAIAARNLEADPQERQEGTGPEASPRYPATTPVPSDLSGLLVADAPMVPGRPSRNRGLAMQPLRPEETPNSTSTHRIRRASRPLRRVFLDHTQNLCNASLQLRVPTRDQGFRIVLHHDVRIDAVPFDNPTPV